MSWALDDGGGLVRGSTGARTGNCFLPLVIARVVKQVGMFVFFTSLSRAQSFKLGALLKSSYSHISNHIYPYTSSGKGKGSSAYRDGH